MGDEAGDKEADEVGDDLGDEVGDVVSDEVGIDEKLLRRPSTRHQCSEFCKNKIAGKIYHQIGQMNHENNDLNRHSFISRNATLYSL